MRINIKCYLLLALGLSQMTADLMGFSLIKGLAAASGASPAPKVFSSVDGLETFSSEFFLTWKNKDSTIEKIKLTPEVYSKIKGPYNRRNVYGAAIAYGPILQTNTLSKEMFFSVSRFAFCNQATLLHELGINPENISYPINLEVKPKAGTNPASNLILNSQENCQR